MSNVTAILLNARKVQINGLPCLKGEVYKDSRGRFPDGSIIHTSYLVFNEGSMYHTANSIYDVVYWAPGEVG